MSTFGVMKARIAKEMKRGELTASATAVQSAVLDSIKFFEARRWAWNQFLDETHTTTADDPYVTLTATLQVVKFDSVKAIIGTRDYPLTPATWIAIDSVDSGQWSGYPEYYTEYDVDNAGSTQQRLRLYPIPNDAYTMKLSGLRKLPEVSASATANATNAWMVIAEEMVRCRAKGYLFRDELRAPQNAQHMFGEAERKATELRRETRQRQGSNRIRATSGYF